MIAMWVFVAVGAMVTVGCALVVARLAHDARAIAYWQERRRLWWLTRRHTCVDWGGGCEVCGRDLIGESE